MTNVMAIVAGVLAALGFAGLAIWKLRKYCVP